MAILYIVATPIGNLQDITLRAVDIIKETEYIVCEDTRKSGFLIKFLADKFEFSAEKFLISYYEQNEIKRIPDIINVLKNGKNVALLSDAGTPLISDPGFKLVRECLNQKIKVEVIPGPSSVTASLAVSGMPSDKFTFIGFLPKKPGHRTKLLENIKKSRELVKTTVILFESPFRLTKTLKEILQIFGDIDLVIARELTKIHEEVMRDKISKHLVGYSKKTPKGEIVILF